MFKAPLAGFGLLRCREGVAMGHFLAKGAVGEEHSLRLQARLF